MIVMIVWHQMLLIRHASYEPSRTPDLVLDWKAINSQRNYLKCWIRSVNQVYQVALHPVELQQLLTCNRVRLGSEKHVTIIICRNPMLSLSFSAFPVFCMATPQVTDINYLVGSPNCIWQDEVDKAGARKWVPKSSARHISCREL